MFFNPFQRDLIKFRVHAHFSWLLIISLNTFVLSAQSHDCAPDISSSPSRRATAFHAVDPKSFVSRKGTQFVLHDSTFYFAGANIYDLFTYGNGGNTETDSAVENVFMDKARIDSQFTRMEKYKVRVVRTWLFNHQTWHGFEPQKGVYYEPQFKQFDYIIESAKKHHVMLIPALENYWEAYGGIDAVLQWEGLAAGQTGRWRYFNKQQCPNCFTTYKNYVANVLNRVNHYSAVAYKNEPTIFAWDLMNEPRYENADPREDTTGITMRLWIDTMAAFVKNIDKNHMVYAGFEGQQTRFGYGGNAGNPFVYCQASPFIDFSSAHPYPTEGWAGLNISKTIALMHSWISLSHDTLDKPFFMGEFNVFNTNNFGSRSVWWDSIYTEMELNNANGSAFWWFSDRPYDNANYGVNDGAPELAVFMAHSQRMTAKNVPINTSAAVTAPALAKAAPPLIRVKLMDKKLHTTGATGDEKSIYYTITGQRIRRFEGDAVLIEKMSK